MKNVISYSLFGEKPIYWYGAIHNIDLFQFYYPNFICRIYVQQDVKPKLLHLLEREQSRNNSVEIVLMSGDKGFFWRFLAAADNDVDICLVRDIDSRISRREVFLVKEWLESDKNFHIIRDHKAHRKQIMGGTWGCRNGILRNIGLSKSISRIDKVGYSQDEKFLATWLYPKVYHTAFEHSSNGIVFANQLHNINIPKQNFQDFVGSKIYNLQ